MALNIPAFLNTVTSAMRSLPVVILYVTEECNLKCSTCSYRKALPGELSLEEIRDLADRLNDYGLKHIAYSGGEPLMRRDFPLICEAFQHYKVRQTLLTNGLLLEKRLPDIRNYFSEIVVSIDGADAETHNTIRGAVSFDQILRGIRRSLQEAPGVRVSLRTVIQKRNFRQLPSIVALGRSLGVDRVSFLAVDVLSDAFGRKVGSETNAEHSSLLDSAEVEEFRRLIREMASTCVDEFQRGFIAQSPAALMHIASYFDAMLGHSPFPRNICNAPMVSAVITSTGSVKSCFFLPPLGNVRASGLETILNSDVARATRRNVRAYTLDPCRSCVCTLRVSPVAALLGRL